jgi:hypothetical protein
LIDFDVYFYGDEIHYVDDFYFSLN